MDTGTIITLGLVIVSLLAKLNESRKKKEAKSNDTNPAFDPFASFDEPVGQAQPGPVSPPVPASSQESVYDVSEQEAIANTEPRVPVKDLIDKRKLIVYSEIMKPKYLE